MKVVVLYNDPTREGDLTDPEQDPSSVDVLVQRDWVTRSLQRLGHDVASVACNLDLRSVRQRLLCEGPAVVVNLVESLGDSDRMMAAATLLLESMRIPATGSRTESILLSGDKVRSKRALSDAGIPSPAWFDHRRRSWLKNGLPSPPPPMVIVKAIHEHASLGMDDCSVFPWRDESHLMQALDRALARTRRTAMAEEFIDGREFNLSLVEREGRAFVLPPAEIDFSDLPAIKPRIVGSAAKWECESIEYRMTPRTFSFGDHDQALLAQLSRMALQCWEVFDLSGYARVDFRVDRDGQPFVLEVNANPCLSPDAGFMAALGEANIEFDQWLGQLLIQHRSAPCF